MPKKDRGLWEEDEDEEEAPELVEADPVEAAVKKAKLKQQAMKERKRERERIEGGERRVRFENDQPMESEGEDGSEDGENSDDLLYDSEDEAKEEEEFQKRQ